MLERQKQREQMMQEQRTRIYSPAQWADFVQAARETEQRNADEARKALERWDYHQSNPDDPVKSCQATFLSPGSGVMLIDMDGAAKGTFIGFFGPHVPRPERPAQVYISLTQSGETQSVKAYHLYVPWDGRFGAILFAVPSTKALLDAIDDTQDYKVVMSGQSLAHGKWHDGRSARDWLRECVRTR